MTAVTPKSRTNRISQRIGSIAPSATLAVDATAKAMKAAGRPVIGFGAGEPDFATPEYIVKAAQQACLEPRFHRYSPGAGLPELRSAVAEKTARDSGYQVLLPTPYWTTYPEAIALAGGVSVDVVADESSGYLVTVDQLDAARTEKTKA